MIKLINDSSVNIGDNSNAETRGLITDFVSRSRFPF